VVDKRELAMAGAEGVAANRSVSPKNQKQAEGDYRQAVSICLLGGKRILRRALRHMIEAKGFSVACMFDGEESFLAASEDPGAPSFDVVVLVVSGGPFTTFHRVSEALAAGKGSVPLVVLSEQASRGQVYASLRIGAKAYVNLDAEPEELFKAIEMGSRGKVYLAPDAAELLVSDISTAIEPSSNSRLPSIELSRREIEIVQLLCEGLSSKEIARRLHISAKTVENHRYNVYRKCEVDSIAGLMRHAIQQGLVSI
jgi:DNA-binding NarL/FixJ family response regulator